MSITDKSFLRNIKRYNRPTLLCLILLQTSGTIFLGAGVLNYLRQCNGISATNIIQFIMIGQNEQILYVMEGEAVVYFKHHQQKQILNAGFTTKKIIITTQRLLIFESLCNRIQETEYELTAPMAKKPVKAYEQVQRKPRISVSQLPEVSIDILNVECKVVIDEEPAIYKFLQKQNIQNISKSMIGVVLLKMPKKMKYYMVHAGTVSNGIRLGKAIICSQSWRKYSNFCRELKVDPNYLWVRVLTETIQNDDSVILIDPDLFVTGSAEQIQAFVFLAVVIPFAHCFHHRYNINTQESARYASEFIVPVETKVHSLSFKETNLTTEFFRTVVGKVTLPNLIRLDLSGNALDDQVFDVLHRLIKAGAKKLTYINLSKNLINLGNQQLMVGMFKASATIMNIDLSHNSIDDNATEAIEKYVIHALNPPLQQINFSFNKFSRKIAWRLFVGNIRNFQSHPYLRFILYPIPIKKEIFAEYDVDFPRHNTTMNLNMHSALVQQFEQESFLKHTFEDIPATAMNSLTINFRRVLGLNVKLPNNRQDLNKTLQISHKIENFIYNPQSVEKIYAMALQLKKFPFEVPPVSRNHFIRYLYEKFNEALFIRDHYSVKYLLRALQDLDVQIEGYTERLSKLKQRNLIFQNRAQNLINFDMDQTRINEELDELVRQGLRLYLQGPGVELIYYLKYKRDQYIQKYLQEKLNPEHYLFDLMAKKNISAQQRVSEKEFIVPYEIRLEKKINEHFYLHPWQANYQILSEMKPETFDACLEFLEESDKKEKFALYFDRIEQRIEFIKNQFTYFTFNKFKASYSDLKINACRLLFLYNNIKETNLYLQIPIYVKKRMVTQQKTVAILNRDWFRREYHIVNYININLKARKANFYNYEGIISRYEHEMFLNQVKKVLNPLNKMLKIIETAVSTKASIKAIIPEILHYLKVIIDQVRHSLVPEQLKEEFYLHIISWRKGRFGNNTEVLQLLPIFTMYLKPPLQIEKFIVAAILLNDSVDLSDFPLCLVTNPNIPTGDNLLILQSQFVERDWIPNDQVFCEIIQKKGRATFRVELLDKETITVTIAESKTVAQLMSLLAYSVEMSAEDREHFWIYKLSKQTQEIMPFESREHVGEILADFDERDSILLLKRRIYSRQLKFNYKRYGSGMINSLYNQVKYQYMCRNLFINDKMAKEIASLFFMIENMEEMIADNENRKESNNSYILDDQAISKRLVEKQKQLEGNFLNYLPLKAYKRLMKSKEVVVAELRARISQRILKNEYHNVMDMKLNLLDIFSKFPQFCSTNYQVLSKQKNPMRISINCLYIYIEYSQQTQYIHLQKLVTVMPKSKYLLLYYHKQQNLISQLPIFAEDKLLSTIIMDILSYCSLRIKMSSINLYEIYSVQATEAKILSLQTSLRRVYDKNLQKDLIKYKEECQAGYKKIEKMSLTIMQFKELQYYKMSNFIKSEVNRKLYANKSERKLDIYREADEEEQQEINAANKKILNMIFPKLESKVVEDLREDQHQNIKQKRFNDPDDSYDFKKDYDKLDFETKQKQEEKPSNTGMTSRRQPEKSYPYEQPSPSFPSANTAEKPEDEEEGVVTVKKKQQGKRGRRRGDK